MFPLVLCLGLEGRTIQSRPRLDYHLRPSFRSLLKIPWLLLATLSYDSSTVLHMRPCRSRPPSHRRDWLSDYSLCRENFSGCVNISVCSVSFISDVK